MKCSFVAWVGKPSSQTKRHFSVWKLFFFLEIYFSILFCWGFFFFFWVAVGSHVACQSLRETWQFLKWAHWQKSNSQALAGCERHLVATSDPTSCSCPHPSAPPRPQPSPRSWHCNFLQHSGPASSPLSASKEKERFTPWIWNIYIYIRSNQCTLKTSWHLISLEKKSVNCFPTKEFVRDVKEALHRVTASFLRIVFIWYIKCSQVLSLKAAFCSVRCCPDSCNKGLGGKCTKVRSNYWFINTQRVEVQLYKMKRQRDSTNQRLVLESHTETWDSSAIDDVAQNNILSSASALKTSGTNNRFAKCLQNQDEVKVY